MSFDIHHSECVAFMRTLPDNSIHAIVTDPPYGLSFMGKRWDYDVPSEDVWRECLRVLKPGGHLLAFAGTRTQHRMAVRIEDAGFEIRDMIAWVYGSGFPKSHDVSKAIDKTAGAEREVVDIATNGVGSPGFEAKERGSVKPAGVRDAIFPITAPATDAAKQWQGWGTALKPALEPITVARKPFTGTVAANVLEHGTGAINVDGCRVEYGSDKELADRISRTGYTQSKPREYDNPVKYAPGNVGTVNTAGRFPANLIHDGSDEVVGLFPETGPSTTHNRGRKMSGWINPVDGSESVRGLTDSGSAARFFYCAKAPKRDRDEGCEGMEAKQTHNRKPEGQSTFERSERKPSANHHPTVKPTDLMRYLCRLVTPPGGTVLDPFMGSGSTGKAAVLEGFNFIGCDMTAEYVDIARARITHAFNSQPNRLDL
jgi:DNA modification methylase